MATPNNKFGSVTIPNSRIFY